MKNRMKIACCLLSLMFLQTAFGDVLVYRLTQTAKKVSDGHEESWRDVGFMIIDVGGSSVSAIYREVSASQKVYGTYSSVPVLFTSFEGKKESVSVLTRGWSADSPGSTNSLWLSNVYLKGANRALSVASGKTASYPPRMSGSLENVHSGDNGEVAAVQYTVRLDYVESMTVTNNNAGNSASTILENLAQQFEKDGFLPDN